MIHYYIFVYVNILKATNVKYFIAYVVRMEIAFAITPFPSFPNKVPLDIFYVI